MDVNDFILSNLFANVNHGDSLEYFLRSSELIRIVSPFISMDGAKWLIENKKENAVVEIVTEINAQGIFSGSQDPDVLLFLQNNKCKIWFCGDDLHAKLFWFDNKNIIITSANLTRGGLSKNFELGVSLIEGHMGNIGNLKQNDLNEYLLSLWNFLINKFAHEFDPDSYNSFLAVKQRLIDLRKNYESVMVDFPDLYPDTNYLSHQRTLNTKKNIKTDLITLNLFSGFREEDWAVFDIDMELNKENLDAYRKKLDLIIDPILINFFKQLKHEPTFKANLLGLEMGTSKNRQRTKDFPSNRYLFLTKTKIDKRATRHIGEPSFILSMGQFNGRRFLEVRAGVEEVYFDELTPNGRRFLSNIKANLGEAVTYLNKLEGGWQLTHGNYSRGSDKNIPTEGITASYMAGILDGYLSSGDVSDMQIRRRYFLDDPEDKKVIFSPQVTSVVAKDFQTLTYFFNLAHL